MPEILSDTIDVVVDDETYTFKIPTIKYRFEIGGRSADIRRRGYPEGNLNERMGVIDWAADNFSRACAIMELYLVRATTPWPYGTDNIDTVDLAKPPKVDFEKFPADKDDLVERVGNAFAEELARFRARGNTDGKSPGA